MVEGNDVTDVITQKFEKYGGTMPTKTMELTGYCSYVPQGLLTADNG